MHVIWKRPDGYHGANPSDFVVIELGSEGRLWLHKTDRVWFPFQISGGWQESKATQKLNNLINLLGHETAAWVSAMHEMYDDTMGDDPKRFFSETRKWITDLRAHLKGDTWELDIMNQTINQIEQSLQNIEAQFLSEVKKQAQNRPGEASLS